MLHHGSIVLRRPHLTPFVAATADVGGCGPAFAERLRGLLAKNVGRALAMDLHPGALGAAEHALATRLCGERYRGDAFVHRR